MKYCKNCGKQCGDGERFCRVCGNAIGGSFAEKEGAGNDIHGAVTAQNTDGDFAVRQADSEPPVGGNNGATVVLGDCGAQYTEGGASDNNQSFDQPHDRPCDCPGDRPATGGQSYDPRQYGEQILGDQDFGGRPFERQPVNGRPYGDQQTNGQPVDGQPMYSKPFDRPQYGNPQQNNMPPYGNAPQYNGSVPPYYNNANIPPYYSNGNVPPYYRQNGYYGRPYAAPQNPNKGNATASLVLGILSIIFSATGIGFILSIIGLVLGVKSMKGYQNGEPGRGAAVAGFVCSIIGLVFSLYVIFAFLGSAAVLSSSSYYR